MTESVIATEKDKTGATVTIKWAKKIGGTAVTPFFLRNYAELIENGHSASFMFGTNNSKAVYAVIDNKVVGAIVYDTQEDAFKTAWIVLSCIDNNYRRRGIYMMLHKHFENVVKNEGSKRLASHVHVDNVIRQASCEVVGMKPDFLRMEKTL